MKWVSNPWWFLCVHAQNNMTLGTSMYKTYVCLDFFSSFCLTTLMPISWMPAMQLLFTKPQIQGLYRYLRVICSWKVCTLIICIVHRVSSIVVLADSEVSFYSMLCISEFDRSRCWCECGGRRWEHTIAPSVHGPCWLQSHPHSNQCPSKFIGRIIQLIQPSKH